MHMLTRSTPRPAREQIPSLTPRMAAIRLIADKIAAGEAGLDPYCTPDFVIDAAENEKVWVGVCANLCGVILLRLPQVGGGEKFRVILDDDVRAELGLDGATPPLMRDEPLASRGVMSTADRELAVVRAGELLIGATLEALDRPRRETYSEPVSLDAMRDAKAAYDQRYPHGVEPQLVIRTDTDGAA